MLPSSPPPRLCAGIINPLRDGTCCAAAKKIIIKKKIYFSFAFPLLPKETSEMYHVINVSWMEGEVLFSRRGNNPGGGAGREGLGPDTSLGGSSYIPYGRAASDRHMS